MHCKSNTNYRYFFSIYIYTYVHTLYCIYYDEYDIPRDTDETLHVESSPSAIDVLAFILPGNSPPADKDRPGGRTESWPRAPKGVGSSLGAKVDRYCSLNLLSENM